MYISLIVAMAENRVIGSDGGMPWHLPEDLKYFKKVTFAKPVIMGRKTYESIGRPLPGRANIVITRNKNFFVEGVFTVGSLPEGLALARKFYNAMDDEIMVIGGGQIYAEALKFADRVYLTEIKATIEGDTVFPNLPDNEWQEKSREEARNEAPERPAISFVLFERI